MESLGTIIAVLVILMGIYSLIAWIIMTTYNNSVVKMNPNWKPMDFRIALFFTLFTQMIFRSPIDNLMNSVQPPMNL